MKKISNKLLTIVLIFLFVVSILYVVIMIVKYKNGTLLEWRNKMVQDEYKLDELLNINEISFSYEVHKDTMEVSQDTDTSVSISIFGVDVK